MSFEKFMEPLAGFEKNVNEVNIGIIGLGYVGLPLAIEFGKTQRVVGFDVNESRISELLSRFDKTKEISNTDFAGAPFCSFTSNKHELLACDVFIVTVPTPVDKNKEPNLNALREASEMLSSIISRGSIVIYESTVYPGLTEEFCGPILENGSNLILNQDFYLGYSPERVNPGDSNRRLTDIVKITSGSSREAAIFVDNLYSQIIKAGTYKVSSIKIAEAAKVIENTQRDVNIALINELAIIFNTLNIDTHEVLEAAGTKWNFLPFSPGLVGGHCIGVDPYYITHKAQQAGYEPDIILAGRKLNDSMGDYIARQLFKEYSHRNLIEVSTKILILGVTFKENCPDIRNSKVFDVVNKLKTYGLDIDCYDPIADSSEVFSHQGIKLIDEVPVDTYAGIVLAVAHEQFIAMGHQKIRTFGAEDSILFDVKSLFDRSFSDLRL
jgi:UDP-N-acetyl-D-glucosamine/UDP-N-acetyl-D-galactosamine dehydrogenase